MEETACAEKGENLKPQTKSGRLGQVFLYTSSFQDPMVAQYEAEKVKFQKLMDKVPDEVKPDNICFVGQSHAFVSQVKEKAKEEKRQKKAFTSGRNAAAELKVS